MRIEENSFSKHFAYALVNKGFFSMPSEGQINMLVNELDNEINKIENNLKTEDEKNELYKVGTIFLIHAISVIQSSEIKIIKRLDLTESKYSISSNLIESLNISQEDENNYNKIYNYAKTESLNLFTKNEIKGNETTRKLMRNFYGDKL